MHNTHVVLATCAGLVAGPAFAAGEPDWVRTGGTASKYPTSAFLVGFAAVESPQTIEQAKNQAAADLAKRVTVRIEQDTTDVSMEKNGVASYAVAALTRATTDVRLEGLSFETYSNAGRSFALAVLERKRGAEISRAARDLELEKLRACVKQGEEQRAAKQEVALRTLLTCRTALEQALSAQATLRVFEPAGADAASQSELAKTGALLDDRVRELLGERATTLAGVIERLVTQLNLQGLGGKGRVTFAPLTYGTTPFSSVLGRRVAEDVEAVLALRSEGSIKVDVVIKGTYFDADQEVAFRLVAHETKSGRTIASAEARLPLKALPVEMPLKPQNFSQALQEQHLLAQGEEVSGNLRVELWTNKGDRHLVFNQGEEVKLVMRVNKPAYVRIVYLLAGGAKVPIDQAYFIDASKVNMAVEYPDTFTVSPPFGIEQIYAVAFTRKPEPLPTVKRVVDGEEYDVVAEVDTLVRHRGIKRKEAAAETSESTVSLTTMPR